ncbi:MAG TPA: sortase [Acidimicrobiales bacterium]|nr:sortase [Acidimicrobiales bacterium]
MPLPSLRVSGRAQAGLVRALGRGLTTLALVVAGYLVFLLVVSDVAQARDQTILFATLRSDLEAGRTPVGGAIREGTPVALLEIPRLHVRQVVLEGTAPNVLKRAPGHLRTRPLPGQPGNAVVAARRSTYGAPFARIGHLRGGDRIRVTTGQGTSLYTVTATTRPAAGQPDVIGPTDDNRLTLVTSDPPLRPSRRLVVTASLQGTPNPAPAGRPKDLLEVEDGVHGDGRIATPLLLASEALLAAAVGAALLYRRWRLWPSWIITTPILVAAVYVVFDSFSGALPATL